MRVRKSAGDQDVFCSVRCEATKKASKFSMLNIKAGISIPKNPILFLNVRNTQVEKQYYICVMNSKIKTYSVTEELINVWSHAAGIAFSVIATIILLRSALLYGTIWHVISYTIYGSSLIILFTASTLYHNSKIPEVRRRLNIFDHAAIYVLIAGTYTPFALISLRGPWGWVLFIIVWAVAIAGVILKLFFTGRFNLASTISYVVMGLIVVVFIKPLVNNLQLTGQLAGLIWLGVGGLFYIIGAILYQVKLIPYNHAIFHFFVLAAAACHFTSIYFYTI